MKFSAEYLRDRICACWTGKNIGGTIGAPFEGSKTPDPLDISGFTTPKGEPLPNDDLDLQLVWLRAVDELGYKAIDQNTLAEYWLSYITAHWNEYGNGKANLRCGILPPMSGELFNDEWKNSNGAWIRTEIWACLFPGNVEQAIKYAYYDASVDHGHGEGTYAAIFVAAVESAAFVVGNLNELIDIGLSKIPEDCWVSRCVRFACRCFNEGLDWRTARNRVIEYAAELGWFQAPANIAFVIIGLLYGAGDFKKSMIIAVDCGDDTDCTGATIGSVMGIMGGMECVPQDWREYIGDSIKSISLNVAHGRFPQSCTELTRMVMNQLHDTLKPAGWRARDGAEHPLAEENDFSDVSAGSFKGRSFVDGLAIRPRMSFSVKNTSTEVIIGFSAAPRITAGGSAAGSVTVIRTVTNMPQQKIYHLRWIVPDGWRVDGPLSLHLSGCNSPRQVNNSLAFNIYASEHVEAVNRLILELTVDGCAETLLAPVVILG